MGSAPGLLFSSSSTAFVGAGDDVGAKVATDEVPVAIATHVEHVADLMTVAQRTKNHAHVAIVGHGKFAFQRLERLARVGGDLLVERVVEVVGIHVVGCRRDVHEGSMSRVEIARNNYLHDARNYFGGSGSAGFEMADRRVEHLVWGRGVLKAKHGPKRGELGAVHVASWLHATARWA